MSTVLIAGGMGDIGRAIAVRFAGAGERIALLYHTTPDAEARSFIEGLPGTGHVALRCDITDAGSVAGALAAVLKQGDPISLCVHAAVASIVRKAAYDIPPEEFRGQFDVTCFGGLNLFQAVVPRMVRGGKILGITTSAADPGGQSSAMAGYVAAKYALRGLLRELSRELAGRGIGVAAVAPGFVPTKLHRDLPEQVFNFLKDRQPAELVSTPEEVARKVEEVCRLDITDMSGKSFPVKGGEPSSL
jgi:3-oxoacyl-[acyl-carrier protein] reductase